MDGWVMWLIMGLLVSAMVIFLAFSFFKDKKKNKIIVYKKIELKNITEKTSKDISLRINTIVKVNNEKIDNFIPSIGELAMKDINSISKEMLKDIYKSTLFKKIYLADDYDPKFAYALKKLIEIKSNHWRKKCEKEISYFNSLEEDLKNDENYEEIKNDILNKVNDKFNKIVKNNSQNNDFEIKTINESIDEYTK